MVSVGRHPNITLLSYSEIAEVTGYVGNFSVTVRRKPRYVNEELCTGCGTCIEKCPWKKIPSEFDLGYGTRAAIYYPFPQAVPRIPVIDMVNCAYFKNGKCGACKKFCPREAIDFEQKESQLDIEVGTIILATGFRDFDPRTSPQYGYGVFPNVLTGMEMERLINSGGPTSGKVLLKNGEKPRKIAILHCVGSRGKEHEYCSRVCCMYSLKLATLIREFVDAEVVEFYRDMRAFGKDYEGFFHRAEAHGVQFSRFDGEIRIVQHNDHLVVCATDVYSGEPIETLVDMVVLSTGAEPQADQHDVGALFGVSRSPDGFFLEKHPKLAPVETSTDGVFLAGACQGPKDIPDSVAQGGSSSCSCPRPAGPRFGGIGTIYLIYRRRKMWCLPHMRGIVSLRCRSRWSHGMGNRLRRSTRCFAKGAVPAWQPVRQVQPRKMDLRMNRSWQKLKVSWVWSKCSVLYPLRRWYESIPRSRPEFISVIVGRTLPPRWMWLLWSSLPAAWRGWSWHATIPICAPIPVRI